MSHALLLEVLGMSPCGKLHWALATDGGRMTGKQEVTELLPACRQLRSGKWRQEKRGRHCIIATWSISIHGSGRSCFLNAFPNELPFVILSHLTRFRDQRQELPVNRHSSNSCLTSLPGIKRLVNMMGNRRVRRVNSPRSEISIVAIGRRRFLRWRRG